MSIDHIANCECWLMVFNVIFLVVQFYHICLAVPLSTLSIILFMENDSFSGNGSLKRFYMCYVLFIR